MAALLWGKVYYRDYFAGFLKQEPGNRYVFTYDQDYLAAGHPIIAHTLPLTDKPFISEEHLHPFFDNLIAEGWMETAQRKLLGKRSASRFELLLAFGRDCAGAVSVVDPHAATLHPEKLDHQDQHSLSLMQYRASLSGIQPKLFLVKEKKQFRLAHTGEVSTHIAKLPSLQLDDLIENEWLTLRAVHALLPQDEIVEAELAKIHTISDQPILIIKRFDRTIDLQKIHFEEFNSLLNLLPHEKYDGAYKNMADFIYQNANCLQLDVYRLFKRILAGLLTGNTDMHFKNFAMMHTETGLRLSPLYDQVAAAIYKPYQYVALSIDRAADRVIGQLKAKTIIALGREFHLTDAAIMMAIEELEKRLENAKHAIDLETTVHISLRNRVMQFMEKRWTGTFSLIGRQLLKKQ